MKTMSMVRGSVAAAMMALGLSVAGTAAARDEASESTCVPDPGNLSAIICTIGSGSGPSTFLGAFSMTGGGWVEFYSDDDGEWWIEHHKDGSTTVGWDVNYLTGPNLSFGSKEGSYAGKSKPSLKGKATKGPKRSFAAAKAAASVKTGTLTSITAPATVMSQTGGPSIELSLGGSGQCSANIIVQKNGQFVSSTGIVPVAFPSKRTLKLPQAEGDYTITLAGRDGCLGQSRTTSVKVTPVRRISFSGLAVKP